MSDINDKKHGILPVVKPPRARIAVRLAECALFVVLMIVSAFVRIPFPFVPLTFQTVVAILAGLLLGPAWGAASVAVYVFIGLLGLPVFTSGGGFAYVFQLTFGYIIGFVAAAFAAGLVRGRGRPTLRRAVIAAAVGFAANYLIGMPYFALIWKYYMHMNGLGSAMVYYNLIYMPKDLILSVLAAVLAERVRNVLSRRR